MSFRRRVEIPADSPFFAGHFPGHPILPGIAHLLLVARILEEETGAPARIAEIPVLKLRNRVHPGDSLEVSGTLPDETGTVRFELRRMEGDFLGSESSESVSQGTLRLGPPDWDSTPALAAPPEPPAGFPPIAALLPHAPPARLVRAVLSVSREMFSGLAEIPAGHPFAQGGRAPSFLGLEAAAQGAGVLEALGRRDEEAGDQGPRIGYLVSLRNARLHTPWLPAERPFRVTVRLTGGAGALSVYDVTAEDDGGAEILRGTASAYLKRPE